MDSLGSPFVYSLGFDYSVRVEWCESREEDKSGKNTTQSDLTFAEQHQNERSSGHHRGILLLLLLLFFFSSSSSSSSSSSLSSSSLKGKQRCTSIIIIIHQKMAFDTPLNYIEERGVTKGDPAHVWRREYIIGRRFFSSIVVEWCCIVKRAFGVVMQ
tara:strand:- start:270 stop:740 length:471 start_codon:yes stop_codon:yes gene_type:complete